MNNITNENTVYVDVQLNRDEIISKIAEFKNNLIDNFYIVEMTITKISMYDYKQLMLLIKSIYLTITNYLNEEEYFCKIRPDNYLLILKCNNMREACKRMYKLNQVLYDECYDSGLLFNIGIAAISKNDKSGIDDIIKASYARYTGNDYIHVVKCYNEELMQFRDSIIEKDYLHFKEYWKVLYKPIVTKDGEVIAINVCSNWQITNNKSVNINPDYFFSGNKLYNFELTLIDKVFSDITGNSSSKAVKINISSSTVTNANFVNDLINLINKYQVKQELVEFMIDEAILYKEYKKLVTDLSVLKIKVGINLFIGRIAVLYEFSNYIYSSINFHIAMLELDDYLLGLLEKAQQLKVPFILNDINDVTTYNFANNKASLFIGEYFNENNISKN